LTTYPPATPATGAVTITSEPSRDTFQRAELAGVSARLFSQRCAEARAQSLPNQDFALLRVDGPAHALSFCVADGVGSSYRGDFASGYLSRRLVDWLSGLETPLPTEEQARATLAEALTAWRETAQAELAALPVDPEAPALVREVLEELRRDYGSAAVFLAGRLVPPEPSMALGGDVEALFCWMGNVTLRLQCVGDAEPRRLCADDDSARWSTLRGLRGDVRVRRMSLLEPWRLIVHTDGADAIGREIAVLSDDDLQRRAAALLETATSDDVAVLDLAWPESLVAESASMGQKRDEP
jgi:hypothetical protein